MRLWKSPNPHGAGVINRLSSAIIWHRSSFISLQRRHCLPDSSSLPNGPGTIIINSSAMISFLCFPSGTYTAARAKFPLPLLAMGSVDINGTALDNLFVSILAMVICRSLDSLWKVLIRRLSPRGQNIVIKPNEQLLVPIDSVPPDGSVQRFSEDSVQ